MVVEVQEVVGDQEQLELLELVVEVLEVVVQLKQLMEQLIQVEVEEVVLVIQILEDQVDQVSLLLEHQEELYFQQLQELIQFQRYPLRQGVVKWLHLQFLEH
jgi:hypothetical protein